MHQAAAVLLSLATCQSPMAALTFLGGDSGVAPPDGGLLLDAGSRRDAGPDAGPACVPGPTPDFSVVAHVLVGTTFEGLASADLDGDGMLDLLVTPYSSSDLTILFGQEDGGLSAPTTYSLDAQEVDWFVRIAVGDLNADGRPDVVLSSAFSGRLAILMNLGAGGLSAPTFCQVSAPATDVGIGDINGDGLPDLVIAEGATLNQSAEQMLNAGGGLFGAPSAIPGTAGASNVAVADFDDDGVSDMAFGEGEGPILVLMSNNGAGFLATEYAVIPGGAPTQTVAGAVPRAGAPPQLVAGAFDLDGAQDAGVVQMTSGEGGTLNAQESYSVPNAPWVILTGDVNGDCLPDIIVAGSCLGCSPSYAGYVLLFPGYSDGGYGPPKPIAQPLSLAAVARLGPVRNPGAIAVVSGSPDFGEGIAIFGDASKH